MTDPIAPERRRQIEAELSRIEREQGVRILLAVESGSRAWGFPSQDSDYDVRIIYAHPRDWYLSVHEGRDVIEQPISDLLDIGGWDLRKTLRLLSGGNTVVHEWLGSPVIYREGEGAQALRQLAANAFNPRAAYHHYFSMAAKKLDPEEGQGFTAKRFLYGMRTLLCARWVAESETPPPMLFSQLLDRYLPAAKPEREAVERLIVVKAGGCEQDEEAGLGVLLGYCLDMVETMRGREAPEARKVDVAELDRGFRLLLV